MEASFFFLFLFIQTKLVAANENDDGVMMWWCGDVVMGKEQQFFQLMEGSIARAHKQCAKKVSVGSRRFW